jgi:hypothetical protein
VTLPAAPTVAAMSWHVSNRADKHGAKLADRHYSRKTIGHPQFTPPGRCLVLLTREHDALWVTSWPYAQYVKHAWAGAWLCTLFRNESAYRSSDLIRQAIAATRASWGAPPVLGMVTFVDPAKIQSRNPGYCFKCAGFKRVGTTKSGLVVLQLLAPDMPPAAPAQGTQLALFAQAEREVTV